MFFYTLQYATIWETLKCKKYAKNSFDNVCKNADCIYKSKEDV